MGVVIGGLLLVGSLAVSACEPQERSAGPSDPDTTLVLSTDPELRSSAAALLPDLAERAGLELLRPVRVEWRTRSELEAYLRAKVDEELPEEEADNIVRSYALLGLVPPDLALRDVLMGLYLEQVVGFYDPDSTALWVMDDQAESDVQTVLLHELVHAVQDQAIPLDSLTSKRWGSDRRTAAQAAIEGHATLVMLEALSARVSGQDVDLSELPGVADLLGPSLAAATAQFPALASAPRILRESLLFPYLAGAGFVLELWTATPGRPAPLGDHLPVSTEQVLHPDRAQPARRDDPVSVDLDSSESIRYEEQLGELGLRVFTAEHLADADGAFAAGWDGDAFALQATPAGDALTWVIVWDDVPSRDRFVRAVAGSDWAATTGAVVRAEIVSGRAASRLLIGTARDLTVTLSPDAGR